jgi:hypothetical protein
LSSSSHTTFTPQMDIDATTTTDGSGYDTRVPHISALSLADLSLADRTTSNVEPSVLGTANLSIGYQDEVGSQPTDSSKQPVPPCFLRLDCTEKDFVTLKTNPDCVATTQAIWRMKEDVKNLSRERHSYSQSALGKYLWDRVEHGVNEINASESGSVFPLTFGNPGSRNRPGEAFQSADSVCQVAKDRTLAQHRAIRAVQSSASETT